MTALESVIAQSINAPLADYMRFEIVQDAHALVDSMFHRCYRQPAPDYPHHVVVFCRTITGEWQPAAYMHFIEHEDYLLGGGACVDDRVLRRMNADNRKAIAAAGGLYFHALRWALAYLSPRCSAIFGYCGNRLAERIDLAAGFVRTPYPQLLVFFTRPLAAEEQNRLIEAAQKIGPF